MSANARIETLPPWVPVAERLPDADLEVDVATVDGDVFAAMYDGSEWRDLTAWPLAEGRVTHWAEKRPHPTEEEAC